MSSGGTVFTMLALAPSETRPASALLEQLFPILYVALEIKEKKTRQVPASMSPPPCSIAHYSYAYQPRI